MSAAIGTDDSKKKGLIFVEDTVNSIQIREMFAVNIFMKTKFKLTWIT